ncbi:MAG TPA: AAA family ATPase [Pyrinomonadaceae bacterium]|jgi:ribosome-binding protein aMBF1 (putative translation factor)
MTIETEIAPAIDYNSIKEEAELLAYEPPPQSAFAVKSAADWLAIAKNQRVPKKLFDEFWYESELCFLFADTNAGKSILAVQIAEMIASGKSEAEAQKVLYFDFELSAKQFERRYCQIIKTDDKEIYGNHYDFSERFFRVEVDIDAMQPERFKTEAEWLDFSFNLALAESEARIIIVDNITYMRNELEKSGIASEMMKLLKTLKKKYDLSILALGHTPKRDLSKPISKNDLGGSKMLINFADSCFAIGESFKDKNLRYLKQIKTRNGEHRYDAENVYVHQIAKDYNFLEFQPLDYAPEKEHLKSLTDKERGELPEQIRNLKNMLGLSQREIAKRLGISPSTVNKYLKADGDVK